MFNPPYWGVFGHPVDVDQEIKGIPWEACGQLDATTAEDVAAGSYFCPLLRSRVRARGTPEEPDHPRHEEVFLIPEPVGPKSDATYRRIGLGKLSGKAPLRPQPVRRSSAGMSWAP